jgi:hypothetical protein
MLLCDLSQLYIAGNMQIPEEPTTTDHVLQTQHIKCYLAAWLLQGMESKATGFKAALSPSADLLLTFC